MYNVSKSRYRSGYVRAANKTVRVPIVAKVRRTLREAYGDSWTLISAKVKERDKQCTLCGDNTRLVVHHIVPVSQGGKTALFNLTTLCESCHSKQPRHRHLK